MSARRQIIAALSEDSMGGIATLQDVARAEQLVDAHRAEVRREDAALIENAACDADFTEDPKFIAGLRAAVELLTRKIGEQPSHTADTGFFQRGHTYADDSHGWKFRVDHITTHPDDGERTALGWRFFNGQWEPYAYGEDDWDVHQHVGHTDVTKAGDRS